MTVVAAAPGESAVLLPHPDFELRSTVPLLTHESQNQLGQQFGVVTAGVLLIYERAVSAQEEQELADSAPDMSDGELHDVLKLAVDSWGEDFCQCYHDVLTRTPDLVAAALEDAKALDPSMDTARMADMRSALDGGDRNAAILLEVLGRRLGL